VHLTPRFAAARLAAVVLVLVAGLTACPSSSSFGGGSTEASFGPTVVDGAVSIDVGVDLEGDGWLERTVSVALDDTDGPVLLELRDEDGRRVDVAVRDAPDPRALTAVRSCDEDDCTAPLELRIQRLDGSGGPVEVAGRVVVDASSYGAEAANEAGLRLGAPAGAAQPSVLGAPSELAISAEGRIAGDLLTIEGADCDAELPWIVALPASADGARDAQVRAITPASDVAVPVGRGVQLPDDACRDRRLAAWVVLAAPLTDRTVAASWVVVGDVDVARARVDAAEARTTESASIELLSVRQPLPPIALPSAADALHLVEGELLRSVAVTGGGPDWVEASVFDPEASGEREPGTELGDASSRWTGSGYAPLVVGPCTAGSCPEEVELSLRSAVPGGPPVGDEALGRVVVTHLLVGG
jgi:hypothetical protein